MIKRIVKLRIRLEEQETFKALFLQSKSIIQSFDCYHVECLQAIDNPYIFFTYRHWASVAALNEYRNSDEFATIWKKTKALFGDRAEAWSTEEVITRDNK